jgi:4-amino-4-deoxy-L-arabinose transferase-like glycosyltransferase
MSPRARRTAFVSLIAIAIAIRVFLLVVLHFGEGVRNRLEGLNDEPAHFNYVKALAFERRIPIQDQHAFQPEAFRNAQFEYYQPPLTYVLFAGLVLAFGEQAGFYACRALSFVFGLLSLLVLDRVLARLGCSVAARRLAVVFLALLPTHAYFTMAVSNDALCWLIALLLTHQLLVVLGGSQGATPRGRFSVHVRIGLLLAAGMLTKSAILIFFPATLAAYAWVAWRGRDPRLLRGALTALAIGAAIPAPWYIRNLIVYDSLFALEAGFGPVHPDRASVTALVQMVIGTVRYFWMPMSHVPGGGTVHDLRALDGAIFIAHVLLGLWLLLRQRRDPGVLLLAGILLLSFAAHVALNLKWAEAEGRFLLPAAAAISYFFVQPLLTLTSRWRRGEALVWTWTALLALHPWIYLVFV